MNEELISSILFLIDEYDCRFIVNEDLSVSLLARDDSRRIFPDSLITIKSINSLYINIINYIIYIGCDLYPLPSGNNKQSKYLNLLNLAGEQCYLDLSCWASSANQPMYNKIKYLDKLNKLDWKLANRKQNSAPQKLISLANFNKNNNLDNYRGDAETARTLSGTFAEANTKANASPKLTIMLNKPDSGESIKEALKEERKKRNLRSKKVVEHLKKHIEKYNESAGLVSYFSRDWFTKNLTSVYKMRKSIDPDMIVRAIDWFFEERWWRGKIDSMSQIEKHFNKFAAAQKGKNGGVGLISQRLKELENGGK